MKLHCVCMICKRFPAATESLLRLANLNELTASRVLLHGCALGNNLQGDFRTLMSYFVSDFRVLIKRQHTAMAHMLLKIATNPPAPIFNDTNVFLVFEFLHLLAEFHLSEQNYCYVTEIPSKFHTFWQSYQSD